MSAWQETDKLCISHRTSGVHSSGQKRLGSVRSHGRNFGITACISKQRNQNFLLPQLPLYPSFAPSPRPFQYISMADSGSSAPKADGLAGMAHSEAHYFNRCGDQPILYTQMLITCCIVTITMVCLQSSVTVRTVLTRALGIHEEMLVR